jgi:hypothetical protein
VCYIILVSPDLSTIHSLLDPKYLPPLKMSLWRVPSDLDSCPYICDVDDDFFDVNNFSFYIKNAPLWSGYMIVFSYSTLNSDMRSLCDKKN